MGLFYIGLENGQGCVSANEDIKSRFRFHRVKMFYMGKSVRFPLIITVGVDDTEQG